MAQVVAKLRARSKLTELKAELETLEAEYREQMQALYDQQTDPVPPIGAARAGTPGGAA